MEHGLIQEVRLKVVTIPLGLELDCYTAEPTAVPLYPLETTHVRLRNLTC